MGSVNRRPCHSIRAIHRMRLSGCHSWECRVNRAASKELPRCILHAPRPSTAIRNVQLSKSLNRPSIVALSSSSSSEAQPTPSSMAWDQTQPGDEGIESLIAAIPFRRLAIWSTMAFLVWSLQDFTGLVVGTFIIAFIGNSFVDSCLAVTHSRSSQRTFPFLHEVRGPS
jgi:hypothetical protein